MKKKMDKIEMNWSAYIRESIATKIGESEMRQASQKLDEIRSSTKSVSTKEIVAWIREDREKNHH
jgi:hypothetical protein